MISINKICPIHIDNFDEYKKYTKALGVKDYYWVSTDSENDLWMPTAREIDKINNPQMLMSYTDGELCEGSVEEIADVIPGKGFKDQAKIVMKTKTKKWEPN